jgi:hypothetical protein
MIKTAGKMIDPGSGLSPDLPEEEGNQEDVDDIVNRAHGYSWVVVSGPSAEKFRLIMYQLI